MHTAQEERAVEQNNHTYLKLVASSIRTLAKGAPTPLACEAMKAGRFGQFHVGIDTVGEIKSMVPTFRNIQKKKVAQAANENVTHILALTQLW